MTVEIPYAWGDRDRERIRLAGVRLHWGEWYEISLNDGVWAALRRDDPPSLLTADSAPGLREQMREDHANRMISSTRAAEGGSL